MNKIRKYTNNNKILEIGACDGLLLSYFKDCHVEGIEPSPVYKEKALKKYGIKLSSTDFFKLDKKFDLIIMSHVFEHLPDLNASIKKLNNLLTKGGLLFIEVPNSPKPTERSKEYINKYLTTPHIYNFTIKSIAKVFSSHGMKVVSLNRYFYNIPKFLPNNTREQVASVFLHGKGFKLKLIPWILVYMIQSIFFPQYSYQEIPIDAVYFGFGDNIRIVLKK